MGRRSKKKKMIIGLIIVFILLCAVVSIMLKPIYQAIGIPEDKQMNVTIVLILIVFAIFTVISIYVGTAVYKGKKGEKQVSKMLNKYASKYGGYVIDDVIIPGENGRTSQIDNILFAQNGIWVIETKNYSGRIYGNENDREWTQVLNYGRTKNHFYNPLKQNETHVNNLKRLFDNNRYVYSCVVLVNDNLYSNCRFVHSVNGLKRYLESVANRTRYSMVELTQIYQKVLRYKVNPIQTNKEHVQEIRDRYR